MEVTRVYAHFSPDIEPIDNGPPLSIGLISGEKCESAIGSLEPITVSQIQYISILGSVVSLRLCPS